MHFAVNMNNGRTGAQTTGTAGSQLLDFGLNYAAADIQHGSTAYSKFTLHVCP